MKKRILSLSIAMILGFTAAHAQKLKVVEGDAGMSFIKGQSTFNIEYLYDNMLVGKEAEDVYKARRIEEFNKKQPGKGERWAEKWVNSRALVYEPMFEELLNKILYKEKVNVTAAKGNTDSKYTIVVKTTMTEPGFNAYVIKVNPSSDFEISFVETSTQKVVYRAELLDVAGIVVNDNDFDFDPSNRIKECYAKAGKVVGVAMTKTLTK